MTPFALARQLAELRHNTRVVMRRYRQIRWTPLAAPTEIVRPEWLRRGSAHDLTGDLGR